MISVIVPAHNEHSVISRTLKTMTARAIPGELDVIVVCNGCTDDTAAVAGSFGPPVRVIETGLAGKTLALNLGDKAATFFPRIYADADVHITIETMRTLANRKHRPERLFLAGSSLLRDPIPSALGSRRDRRLWRVCFIGGRARQVSRIPKTYRRRRLR